MIHNTAIIHANAKIADNVEIGPYVVIGDKVKINSGTKIKSHVVIEGDCEIGMNNIIYPFATIGVEPQDLKFHGEDSKLVIGDNNKIREHVTIHRGTKDGGMITKIGSNNLLMVGVHIAHDCLVGDHVILANNATLAGHVQIENNVVIGGLSAVHQFVRIGKGAMIGGMSGVGLAGVTAGKNIMSMSIIINSIPQFLFIQKIKCSSGISNTGKNKWHRAR